MLSFLLHLHLEIVTLLCHGGHHLIERRHEVHLSVWRRNSLRLRWLVCSPLFDDLPMVLFPLRFIFQPLALKFVRPITAPPPPPK